MRAYRFRLDAVLRLRRAEEEQARLALMAANAGLRVLIEARDRELANYRRLAGRAEATTSEALAVERHEAELAAAALAHAEQRVGLAAAEVAAAQVAWRAVSRSVAALERLDERRRAEHEEAARRQEVALIDDLVTARYAAGAAGQPERAS